MKSSIHGIISKRTYLILLIAMLISSITGCASDRDQYKWKVIVTSDNPMSYVSVTAKDGEYNMYEHSDEEFNSTKYETKFRANEKNEIKVMVETHSTGNMKIQIYQGKELRKESEHLYQGTSQQYAWYIIYKN